MRECPVQFTGPMVRAIMAGQKTQTRRVVKPDLWPHAHDPLYETRDGDLVDFIGLCPYGSPGDRLWVKETFCAGRAATPKGYGIIPRIGPAERGDKIVYRASWDGPDQPPWRPPMFMPRWASRIALEVTDVRVQWVQDITEEGAVAEGVQANPDAPASLTDRSAFATLWDALNAKRGYPWESNPWVWAITFQPEESER